MKLRYESFCEFDAVGIYFEATLKNPALPGFKVEVFAGCPKINDLAPSIFQFFKAALATLPAKLIPLISGYIFFHERFAFCRALSGCTV